MEMCPEKERYSRETLSLCNRFEFDANETINHCLMVKEYSRSSADQDVPLANELRPINILFETMLYLITQIIPKIESSSSSFPIGEWYDFVWNRTRSIRKDIIQQRLLFNDQPIHFFSLDKNINHLISTGLGGVIIIEQCARFHIMCAYRLCAQSSNVFDFKINEENLNNCLQSLRQYYETNLTTSSIRPSPNQSEFCSYIILFNLNQTDILSQIQRWSAHIRNSLHVKFALNVYFAFNSRNYVRFFRLIKSNACEYLQACILHRFFYTMRTEAFKSIFNSYKDQKLKRFPFEQLNTLLGFNNCYLELKEYCDTYGLEVIHEVSGTIMVVMCSNKDLSCFNISKSNDNKLSNKLSALIDEKFRASFMNEGISSEANMSQIIAGPIGVDFSTQSNILSSFSSAGFYCGNEIKQALDSKLNKKQAMPALINSFNLRDSTSLTRTIFNCDKEDHEEAFLEEDDDEAMPDINVYRNFEIRKFVSREVDSDIEVIDDPSNNENDLRHKINSNKTYRTIVQDNIQQTVRFVQTCELNLFGKEISKKRKIQHN